MPIKGKILIATSDKKTLPTLKQTLDQLKYEINSYSDLKKLAREIHAENPDLLIFDADTVAGDSFEMSKKIKSGALAKVPILLLTANPMDQNFMKVLKESKIDEYIRKPVSYALLLEKVKRLLMVDVSGESVEFDEGQQFDFTGNFLTMPFPRILYCMKRDGLTGMLSVVRENFKKVISFERGDPKFVVSNIVQECLGRLLVAKGRLTEPECEESLRLMKEWKKKQGETLIKMGLIEPYELDETLKMQAKERLLETFSWQTGEYKFLLKKFLREDLTPIDLEIPQICLLGIRRYYTLDILKRYLDRWLDFAPRFNDGSFFKLDQFRLATWDTKTARLVDGKKTLRDVISNRIVREVDVYHLIFAFYSLSVISFLEVEASKKAKEDSIDGERRKFEESNAFKVLDLDYETTDEEVRKQFDAMLIKYSSIKAKNPGSHDSIDKILNILKESYAKLKDKMSRNIYIKQLFLEEGIVTKKTAEVVTQPEIIAKGKNYLSKNDYESAKNLFLNSAKMFPEAGILYAYLGYTHFLMITKEGEKKQELLEEAQKYLRVAITKAPVEEDPHLFYGRVLKVMGNEDEALKEFKRVVQINPYNNDAVQEARVLSMRIKKKESSFIKWKK